MLDSRNRTRTIAHLLKYVSPVDLWEFLGDFSLFLYDLDMTGAWRAERLTGENWRRTVERLSQAYPALPRSSSLRPVHSLSAKAAAEILEDLCASPATLHENTAAVFREALRQVAAARGSRDFLTPAPLAELMADMLRPGREERVLDPACGSGGLLAACAARCGGSRFCGVEIHPTFAAVACFHLHFRGVADPAISVGDFFAAADQMADTFDVVLANPPYSGDLQQTVRFLTAITAVLKPGGRCGVLVPEGLLSNTASSLVVDFKRELLGSHTLDAVVSLPKKIYKPYTESKSSLVLLRKGRADPRPVFYAELPEFTGAEKDFSPSVYRDDMARIAAAWRRYAEDPSYRDPLFWPVTGEELERRGYDLSFTPSAPAAYPAGGGCEERWRARLMRRQEALGQLLQDYVEGKP